LRGAGAGYEPGEPWQSLRQYIIIVHSGKIATSLLHTRPRMGLEMTYEECSFVYKFKFPNNQNILL